MAPYGVKQVPGEDDLRLWNSPGGRRNNRVVASHVRVYDIKPSTVDNGPQPDNGKQISRIQKGKSDVSLERPFTPACDDNGVSESAQFVD